MSDTVSSPNEPSDFGPNHPALSEQWYYTMELKPGVFTTGLEFHNILLTRALLGCTHVADRRCLDIGAMDGLVSVLCARRGAKRIIAYDRTCFRNRIDLVNATMGVNLEYVSGIRLRELRPLVRAMGAHPFDVVICSGVLYHVLDPLGSLLYARGQLREGGILIVETAVVFDDTTSMHFNAGARFYPSANYWMFSPACLDYLLRLVRLQPIDCVWFHQYSDKADGSLSLGRLAVACRAVDAPLAEAGDSWMAEIRGSVCEFDFAEYLDWPELTSTDTPVQYDIPGRGQVQRPDVQSIDLRATVEASPEMVVTDRQSQLTLPLNAMV